MDFQHAYSKPFRGSDLKCEDPSLAQQQFKDDVDINVLLERFKVTGVMPQNIVLPQYGDYTGIADYRTAAEVLRKADNAFMDLPAHIRARFSNDPQRFLEFIADDKNRDEAIRLGLVNKPSGPPAPMRVEVVGGIGGVAPDVNAIKAATGSSKP